MFLLQIGTPQYTTTTSNTTTSRDDSATQSDISSTPLLTTDSGKLINLPFRHIKLRYAWGTNLVETSVLNYKRWNWCKNADFHWTINFEQHRS